MADLKCGDVCGGFLWFLWVVGCHLGYCPQCSVIVTPSPSLGTCPPSPQRALFSEIGSSKGSGPIHASECAPPPLSHQGLVVEAEGDCSHTLCFLAWILPSEILEMDTIGEGDPGLEWVHENLAAVAAGKGWWSWRVGERSYDNGGLVLTVYPQCPPTPCHSREIHWHLAGRRR